MLILDVGIKSATQRQRIKFSKFKNLKIIDKDFQDQGILLVSVFNLKHHIAVIMKR